MLAPGPALAHPSPFSYVNLRLEPGKLEGTLVVDVYDVAHDLQITRPATLLTSDGAARESDAFAAVIGRRLQIVANGKPLAIAWGRLQPLSDGASLSMPVTIALSSKPGADDLRSPHHLRQRSPDLRQHLRGNLLVRGSRDLRGWIAFAFGFIDGFGFASVLQEMDLPRAALGWSLFSFNAGVEIGQMLVVIPVATALGLLHRHSENASRRLAFGGSLVVILAGAFWFAQRVFFPGT